MAWLFLVLGGILEIAWAFGLKYSDGFTNIPIVIPTVIAMILSFWFFSKSLQLLPVSTAYAIFTGIGSFGTALIGMLFLGDPFNAAKIFFLTLLIGSIIGLKLVSNEAQTEKER
jgi:quaternary ammonium compound-resistance protein SugE